jgi:hypothetical protein
MIRKTCSILSIATILAACSATSVSADPITYQGRLTDGNVTADGMYDFQFLLFTQATGGSQIGPTNTINDWDVELGLFTVDLDFGAGAFDGAARWIEIRVRSGVSVGAYTTLDPRQPVTAAPMALYALGDGKWTKSGSAITNANSGFVGVNRTTAVTGSEFFGVQAPVASGFGGMYIRTNGETAVPFYGYKCGNSGISAWTELDGSTGNFSIHTGNTDALVIEDDGDVGIGDTTPTARLEVAATDSHGIIGRTTAAFSYGVSGTGTSAGVRGTSSASNGAGVEGVNNATGGAGVEGSTSAAGSSGVAGYGNNGTGVYGQSFSGYGIYGTNGGSTGHAGYFNGKVHVDGVLSKSGGSFKIDHPLDPANKTLSHSFVESPDMMNIYNGVVALDNEGAATVQMPSWFSALNTDFRYQLTAIGAPGPNLYIAREIENNAFAIAGGTAGMKVSWMVTGIRHDAWAKQNRIPVEQDKADGEKGRYLTPAAFGLDASMAIHSFERAQSAVAELPEADDAAVNVEDDTAVAGE